MAACNTTAYQRNTVNSKECDDPETESPVLCKRWSGLARLPEGRVNYGVRNARGYKYKQWKHPLKRTRDEVVRTVATPCVKENNWCMCDEQRIERCITRVLCYKRATW